MAGRVSGKIKLQSVDELLGVPEIAGTQEIEISRIHTFPNHPFKVLDDDKMETLVESIRENGILNPVIVRPDQTGNYEMISGHRRLHAAGIVGLEKIPAIVKEMSDDEAIIKMVDANIQREEILPSERAWSLKMKMDAMRRQGSRTDLTCGTECQKLSSDEVGEAFGLKGRQVRKYVRLTELTTELMDCVDVKKIPIAMAVDISYFDEHIQKWIYEYIKDNGFLKPTQVDALKDEPNLANVNQHNVISILNSGLPQKTVSAKVSLSEKKLDKYFSSHYSSKEREDIIIQLLEQWSESQEQE
jgi:ParB family transcriptional regulator, chromosome partitioning protein